MADYEFLRAERESRLTIVTINRPEVYNALHSPAHFEFHAVFDDFAADPEQWVAIVTGAGDKAFSAGNDLKYQAAGGPRARPLARLSASDSACARPPACGRRRQGCENVRVFVGLVLRAAHGVIVARPGDNASWRS